MNKLVLLALIVVGISAACEVMYPTYMHRYRLTIEVDVDGMVHRGSSVIEVSVKPRPRLIAHDIGATYRIQGDATYVDLGNAGNLFAILAGGRTGRSMDAPIDLAVKVFDPPSSGRPFGQYIAIKDVQGKRELSVDQLPTLVTFSSPKDPNTARVVAPDSFTREFGRSVKFKRAFIEMTTDPVTRGIERLLPWINEYRSRGLGTHVTGSPQQFIAGVPYFSRG
jgi:hypothetical protein